MECVIENISVHYEVFGKGKPVFVLAGRQDAIVGYDDAWNLVEKYPRATFVVLDRAGHPLEEKEELVKILVNDWLDRVEESGASV